VSTYVLCLIVIPVFNSSAALYRIILKEILSFQKIKKKKSETENLPIYSYLLTASRSANKQMIWQNDSRIYK